MNRPDLFGVSPEIVKYIEVLEEKIRSLEGALTKRKPVQYKPEAKEEPVSESSWTSEPPGSAYIVTITEGGVAKRSLRHLYNLQRRGGMGIFDIETDEDDPPVSLTIAEPDQTLLLITNYGRAFRVPVQQVMETPIHARGTSVTSKLDLDLDEKVSQLIPIHAEGYLALISERGFVRLLRHHVFGEYLKPGTSLLDVRQCGKFAGACWTPGNADLIVASQQGKAIRFSEKSIAPQNTLGIRLNDGDKAIGVAAVDSNSSVFMLGADGKGTVRLMENFTPNKSPGSSGKIAMATDQLVAILTVQQNDHLLLISKLSKIIRFRVSEIPEKEGVVQGVVCMNLRADTPIAAVCITI